MATLTVRSIDFGVSYLGDARTEFFWTSKTGNGTGVGRLRRASLLEEVTQVLLRERLPGLRHLAISLGGGGLGLVENMPPDPAPKGVEEYG